MFGESVFADVIFADMAAITVPVPPIVLTTAGSGDMIPVRIRERRREDRMEDVALALVLLEA